MYSARPASVLLMEKRSGWVNQENARSQDKTLPAVDKRGFPFRAHLPDSLRCRVVFPAQWSILPALVLTKDQTLQPLESKFCRHLICGPVSSCDRIHGQ